MIPGCQNDLPDGIFLRAGSDNGPVKNSIESCGHGSDFNLLITKHWF